MGKDKLTYLGRNLVSKILDAANKGLKADDKHLTEEEAVRLMLKHWDSDVVQDILHGYANHNK